MVYYHVCTDCTLHVSFSTFRYTFNYVQYRFIRSAISLPTLLESVQMLHRYLSRSTLSSRHFKFPNDQVTSLTTCVLLTDLDLMYMPVAVSLSFYHI